MISKCSPGARPIYHIHLGGLQDNRQEKAGNPSHSGGQNSTVCVGTKRVDSSVEEIGVAFQRERDAENSGDLAKSETTFQFSLTIES